MGTVLPKRTVPLRARKKALKKKDKMLRIKIKEPKKTAGTTKMSGGKEKRGFSLIEVLITIFILAVVVITLISVFIYGFNLLSKTKQVALATHVAQLEVEEYRNMAFDNITNTAETTVFIKEDFPFLFRDDDSAYLLNGQESITIEDGPDANIKKLTVTIMWDYRGQQMRRDVVTYISKNGINRR